MKPYSPENIRNVGFIGHGGAGKTSILESILYLTGVSDRLGKVGDNSSVMDFDPDEVKRGHSISASLSFCEYQKHKLNLLDTPGSNNFVTDTPGCIRVVDGVVVVLSAEAGVQYYTEKTWQWADQQGLQKIIFINKMDSDKANLKAALDGAKKKFKINPMLLQVPVGSGSSFEGVVDLIENKYYKYEKGGKGVGEATEVPAELADEVETSRAELVEVVAEADDDLIETYLEKGELSDEEFHTGLQVGIQKGQLVPVLLGAGAMGIGTDRLLDAMLEYLPSPDKRPPMKARALKDDKEVEVKPDPGGGLAALVFKTIVDPYAGKLTLFRVYSGTLKGDSSVHNATQGNSEKLSQLLTLQGKKQVPVTEVPAGDIAVVAKLKSTTTNDTLTLADAGVKFEPIEFPKPVLARAMIPKTRADEEKISNALARLVEEDPALNVERDPQTHQLLVSGLGQEHLDVVIERLKRRFSVDVDTKPPKVPYRETIRGKTKVQGKHKKQSGGRGQFGDCWLEIMPLPRGRGFEFENKIVGGAIPKTYIPAVEKGVQEAMEHGTVANYPMVDVKVVLYDGSYHDVDSSEMAFKIAGSIGFKKGVKDCKPILLEPIMTMEVNVPSECVGDVMGDLNSKRGKILGVDASDEDQTIRAHVPMASILNYAPELRALTGGRGVFVMEFDHYDVVPEHLTAKIVEETRAEAEASH
ncbi:Elongation factor G [Nitrospina gracilis 3/211]|uniref:Elongation factor G n=1 Tax=Nitrospina gracilis (strain 3/211) TaxID=1266370 RepID=M1Z2K6_NITG3|nr:MULTISPECIES: elongation factor G [Nitrospina]MCF8724711.1 elongation factor G [Nitrospina sp. Nb-3]CCQ91983.1 Elongation factor G [Nitrospina gracilis 3/211]